MSHSEESSISHSRVHRWREPDQQHHHKKKRDKKKDHHQRHQHKRCPETLVSSSSCDSSYSADSSCSTDYSVIGAHHVIKKEIPKHVLEKLLHGQFDENFDFLSYCEPHPDQIAFPKESYPKPKFNRSIKDGECDECPAPRAPIILTQDQGPTFSEHGKVHVVKATAGDTDCKAELEILTLQVGASQQSVVNCTSDVFFYVISGEVVANINTIDRILPAGNFAYIHSGSPYALANPSLTTPAVLFLGFLKAGSLGFYREVACLQAAVGGPWNVDPSLVEKFAKQHFIFFGSGRSCFGSSEISFVPPGTVRFLPMPIQTFSGKSESTWGLNEKQTLLISSVLSAPPLAPGIVKTSATIQAEDCDASIVLEPTTSAITISAAILKDYKHGACDQLCNLRINDLPTFILLTGVSYFVSYDGNNGGLKVLPTDPRLQREFLNGQISF